MERDFGETVAVSDRPAAELPRRILPGTTVGGEVGTFSVDFVLWNGDKTVGHEQVMQSIELFGKYAIPEFR